MIINSRINNIKLKEKQQERRRKENRERNGERTKRGNTETKERKKQSG